MSNKSNIKTPLDPSGNFAEIINDTSGLTGITTNNTSHVSPTIANGSNVGTSSKKRFEVNKDIAEKNLKSVHPSKEEVSHKTTNVNNGTTYLQNETLNQAYADSIKSERSVSGSTSDPASDDDTLQNAKDVGLALSEDEEHPQALDIGGDVDKAEEYQRTH